MQASFDDGGRVGTMRIFAATSANWRQMRLADLPDVVRIAAEAYPDLPESEPVFADRLRLFSPGCLVTERGYAIAHPARFGQPAPLNSLLERVAVDANALHVHDLALLATRRGLGLGAAAINYYEEVARAYGLAKLTLIAVHGTETYWRRYGYVPVEGDTPGLETYGPGAVYMVRNTPPQRPDNR